MTPEPLSTEDTLQTEELFTKAAHGKLTVIELLNAVEQILEVSPVDVAIRLYRVWLSNNDSSVAHAVWFNLGVSLSSALKYEEAVEAYLKSIALSPMFLPARFNLGTTYEKLEKHESAISTWYDILSLPPSLLAADPAVHKLTLNNLGRLLETRHRYPEAEEALHRSLQLDCRQPDVIQHWLHLRQKQCSWPLLASWPSTDPEQVFASASALSTLALTDDPALQRATARRFVENRVITGGVRLASEACYNHGRLRIGYISGDFCLHPVSMLMVDLFECHDHEYFEIYAYCWSPEDNSSIRKRVIAAMDHFVSIKNIDDEAAARLIRDDEIDILVDLQGLTSGARPNLLALRPAPVQVSWLGFPGTTGHPEIDYIITDKYVIPPETAAFYSETPVSLPGCFQPSDRHREVAGKPPARSECGLPEGAFVFCCFNNSYKITPEQFRVWMRILRQVPGSVLWLIEDNPSVPVNLRKAAEADGFDPSRLVFSGRVAPPVYLARYTLADLFLDTMPFNAGTTANDAIWMGLPVLTMSGKAFASRMAGSLLSSLGLASQLVTSGWDDYERRAVELATERLELKKIRNLLISARTSAAIFNTSHFARELESVYRKIAPVLAKKTETDAGRKVFLHVGCGSLRQMDTLPCFNDGKWHEIRLDIDPDSKPDLLASMTDLGALSDSSVDAVYSSHNLEHLYSHEVSLAFREFIRVLRPDGFVVVRCPDLQSVCARVAANRLTEPAYISPAGPISPLDMLYGHALSLSQGKYGMAHRSGFTCDSLEAAFRLAGFGMVSVFSRPEYYELTAIATKQTMMPDAFAGLIKFVLNRECGFS